MAYSSFWAAIAVPAVRAQTKRLRRITVTELAWDQAIGDL